MVKALFTGPEIGSHIENKKNPYASKLVQGNVDEFRDKALGKFENDLFERVREVEMKQDSYDKLTSMPLPLFDELIGIILSNPNLKSEEVDELLEIVEVSLENNNGVLSSKLVKGGENVENNGIIVKMTKRDFRRLEMISENDFKKIVNVMLSVPGISIKGINELLKNKKIESQYINGQIAA